MVNQVYLMKTIASAPLAENVMMPQYDRQKIKNADCTFWFRCFSPRPSGVINRQGAERAGRRLGICEISLFSGDRLMRQLREQDHLFTVLEKGLTATSLLLSVPLTNA